MLAEPELGESADPRALVRGDPAAVRATAERLAALAAGCAATAGGLDAMGVRGWSGAAASAFRERHAELSARWSRAAAAFRSAAQAWERFGIELVAAQELAAAAVARFSTAGGPLAAEAGLLGVTQHVAGQASAGPAVSAPALAGRVVRGQAPAAWPMPGPAPVDSVLSAGAQVADLDAARRMLAEARARRDRAAVAAAREIAAAAALAPDPPGDGERRAPAAADWVRANGVALGHVARGVGEGVEDLVRFTRLVNPADPYNLNHPGRFLANASTALAGAVDDVVHPVRQVAGFVGPGWGSDPARAYGHLLPTAVLTAVAGAGRSTVRGPGPRTAPAALGATEPAQLWTGPDRPPDPSRPLHHPPPPCPLHLHRLRLYPLRLGLRPIRLHLRPSHRLRRHRVRSLPMGSHRRRPLRPLTVRRLIHFPPRRPHLRPVRQRVGWPMRPRPRRRPRRRRPRRRLVRRPLARRRLARRRRPGWSRRRTGPRPGGWRKSRAACRRIQRS